MANYKKKFVAVPALPNTDDFVREKIIFSLLGTSDFKYIDGILYKFYRSRIDVILLDLPLKDGGDEGEDIYDYAKRGLKRYLKKLFYLFKEIMCTKLKESKLNLTRGNESKTQANEMRKLANKLIVSILDKKLKAKDCVDWYLTDTDYVSPFIESLITENNGHYYLKNADIKSIDFKLALISCFWFFNDSHALIFERKMLEFYQ